MQVIESDAESGDCVSIEREQPSTAFKPMPAYGVDSVVARQVGHQTPDIYIKIGDILPPFKADELTGAFNALNKTTNFDDRGMGPISSNGVFKPQSIENKGSVIVGDNHFRTAEGGDSLTGIETSQLTDQPTDDYVKLGDIKGVTGEQDPGALYCTGHCFETFETIAGMYSFGELLNRVFEIGGTSGPGGTSFMTGNIGFPTNNIEGSVGPGGDDI